LIRNRCGPGRRSWEGFVWRGGSKRRCKLGKILFHGGEVVGFLIKKMPLEWGIWAWEDIYVESIYGSIYQLKFSAKYLDL
jgi:hypothetical protein